MNALHILLPTLISSLYAASAAAQPETPTSSTWGFSLESPATGVGLETSALWPVFPGHLFLLRSVWSVPRARGGLLVGVQGHIPHDREAEGRFASLSGQLGWRQFIAYGLHVDALVNAGWGRLRDSTIDGQDYDSFDVELIATAGWRFAFGPLYAVLQPVGIGAVVYKSNPWPIQGRSGAPRTEGPIFVGNVMLGYQF